MLLGVSGCVLEGLCLGLVEDFGYGLEVVVWSTFAVSQAEDNKPRP